MSVRFNPHKNALPSGYRLQCYTIHDVLGQGGFGITYLAHDQNLNRAVAIKEYLPVDLTVREADGEVSPVSAKHREDFAWGLAALSE